MKSIKQISAMLLMAFIPAAILVTGCGAEEVVNNDLPPREVSEEEDGTDWRTYRSYVSLDQKTPDGVVKLLAAVYEADGCVIVAPDDFSYKPYPDLVLVDGVHDFSTVQDNMYMADFNGDGYDDLSIDDLIDGARVSEVFIFNNFDNYFEYSDEYSLMLERWKEAAYSDHVFNEEDRAGMKLFMDRTIADVKSRMGMRDKLKVRFVTAL